MYSTSSRTNVFGETEQQCSLWLFLGFLLPGSFVHFLPPLVSFDNKRNRWKELLGVSRLLIKSRISWKCKVPLYGTDSFFKTRIFFSPFLLPLVVLLLRACTFVFMLLYDVYLCDLIDRIQLHVMISLILESNSFRPGIWQWRRYCLSPPNELETGLKKNCDF